MGDIGSLFFRGNGRWPDSFLFDGELFASKKRHCLSRITEAVWQSKNIKFAFMRKLGVCAAVFYLRVSANGLGHLIMFPINAK